MRRTGKRPIVYEWARLRVVDRDERWRPGRARWLLARRSVTDPTEIKYFLSNAPTTQSLFTVAWIASTQFTVEQCFKEAKGQTGLNQYEVRRWHSWHRHITLSMMAHTWLMVLRAEEAGREAAAQKGGAGSLSPLDGA